MRKAHLNILKLLLFKNGQSIIQKRIVEKAISLGANLVLGFKIKFDLEPKLIVARALGTACKLEGKSSKKHLFDDNQVRVHTTGTLEGDYTICGIVAV